jgi:hypothetical protein
MYPVGHRNPAQALAMPIKMLVGSVMARDFDDMKMLTHLFFALVPDSIPYNGEVRSSSTPSSNSPSPFATARSCPFAICC